MSADEQKKIDEAIARFPKTFGLRGYPDEVFRISKSASYFTGYGASGSLMLYTERKNDKGQWNDFAKGTESELRSNVVPIPSKILSTRELDDIAKMVMRGAHNNAIETVNDEHGRTKVKEQYGEPEKHPEFRGYYLGSLEMILVDCLKDCTSYFPQELLSRRRKSVARWEGGADRRWGLTETETDRVKKRIEKLEHVKLRV